MKKRINQLILRRLVNIGADPLIEYHISDTAKSLYKLITGAGPQLRTPPPFFTRSVHGIEKMTEHIFRTDIGTETPPLMNAKQVATILKISSRTVQKLVRERKLACVQVTARERRFTAEQVQQYIESQSTGIRVDKDAARPVKYSPKKGGAK